MGTTTLNNKNSGDTILAGFWNDIHSALEGDFLGRDSSGAPTSGQNLGSAAVPWGALRCGSIIVAGASLDTSKIVSPVNRIVSGKTRSTSNQPAFITPNGAAASCIVAGASTSLVFDVNGTAVTLSADLTKSSLTLAAASNNTCLINDTSASGQEDTRLWGEYGHRKVITVDGMESNITALVGKYACFKIGTEYFIAFVQSITSLEKCWRGYFYDSSINPKNRVKFSDDDTITLMNIGFVFLQSDATTLDVTYSFPTYSAASPTSPVTGDYWYDTVNKTWKRYDGASFQIINRTLIGAVVMDSSNCVAARCIDFSADYKKTNELDLEVSTTEIVRGVKQNQKISVAGNDIFYGTSLPQWNITTDLATSSDMYHATEQASTLYYLYIKDDGAKVISDITPYWRPDFSGWYHPHNPWRMAGIAYNNGSSNIVASNAENQNTHVRMYDSSAGLASTNTAIRQMGTIVAPDGAALLAESSSTLGASITCMFPCTATIEYGDSFSSDAGAFGIGLNAPDLTAAPGAGNIIDYPAISGTRSAVGATMSACLKMKIGDVVRPTTTGGGTTNADAFGYFKGSTTNLNS